MLKTVILAAALLSMSACTTVFEDTECPSTDDEPAVTIHVRSVGAENNGEQARQVPAVQTPSEPVPAAETPPAEATPEVPTQDCGFTVRTWPGVDTDGDGQGDQLSTYAVQARPAYRLRSAPEMSVRSGESVAIDVEVSSENGCGDLLIAALNFSVTGTSNNPGWLKQVNDARVPAFLFDPESDIGFAQFAATNMDVTPDGQQLFYAWTDHSSYLYGANWDHQWVPAAGHRVFRFIWTASAFAQHGATVTISLAEVTWADYRTGRVINADSASQEAIAVTVHITG